MKILSIECSAKPCSAAIICDGEIVASAFKNEGLTHSQTLLPMVEDILKNSNLTINDIDGFAVSSGPGSFTGIRIGISLIKGLAAPRNLPCVPISTLEAMAYNLIDKNCIACAVMDARCNQLYNALFRIENGVITRLCEDRALLMEDLKEELSNFKEEIIILGDGAEIFHKIMSDAQNCTIADKESVFQNAKSVGYAALKHFENNNTITADKLLPSYLRLPQAERELKLKKENLK